MNKKSSLQAGLFALCASCAVLVHADQLADPLALAPAEATLPNNTGMKATASAPAAGLAPATGHVASAAAQSSAQAKDNTKPVAPPTHAVAPGTPVAPSNTAPSTSAKPQSTVDTQTTRTSPERAIYSQTTSSTFLQLDHLRTQNVLLAERVKAAELTAKLANLGPGIGIVGASSPSAAAQRGVQVTGVYAVDHKFSAEVTLNNGSLAKVQEGSTIPGMGRVKSITRDAVLVATKAGTIISLDFAPINSFPGAR